MQTQDGVRITVKKNLLGPGIRVIREWLGGIEVLSDVPTWEWAWEKAWELSVYNKD